MHYADMADLLRPLPPDQDRSASASGDGEDGQRRQRRRPHLAQALAALYPPGEVVELVAGGTGLSRVVAVTDKQRLYIFRPVDAVEP
jgi:hypothetical protein